MKSNYTQEEKELLLKDLCSRLSYGIIVYRISDNSTHRFVHSDIVENVDAFSHFLEYSGIDNIKPYLRAMSSMTEEEKKIICSMNMLSDVELSDRLNYQKMYVQNYTIETFDLFNAHYLDYRGLIQMGLALVAPEEMYKVG